MGLKRILSTWTGLINIVPVTGLKVQTVVIRSWLRSESIRIKSKVRLLKSWTSGESK